MRILVMVLSFLNGGYMLADGIHVLLKGKYIGPEKPGPWADLFTSIKVDVFALGPLFIVFGLAWIFWAYSFWAKQKHTRIYGMIICIMTLWWVPVGTLFSIIVLLTLIFSRRKIGLL